MAAPIRVDPEEVPTLAAQLGIDPDRGAMSGDERVRAVIQSVVGEANARFARIEQIKRFAVLDRNLTQADGELTPTLKVKRRIVYKRFADVIDALYAD